MMLCFYTEILIMENYSNYRNFNFTSYRLCRDIHMIFIEGAKTHSYIQRNHCDNDVESEFCNIQMLRKFLGR